MSSTTPNPATDSSLTIADKAKVTQADNIRNTMNVNNLLSPVSDTPDVPATPIVTAPSTPIKCIKEEFSSPDTVMSELVGLNIYSLSHSAARPSGILDLTPGALIYSNAIQ